MKLNHSISFFKWIKYLSFRLEILKLLEKKVGKTHQGIGMDGAFLKRNPVAQQIKPTVGQWEGSHEIRMFFVKTVK